MFEPKKKTATIDGQKVVVRQLTLEDTNRVEENADMAEVVALSWDSPGNVTAEQVRKWPTSVVKEIYELCLDLNGYNEGN